MPTPTPKQVTIQAAKEAGGLLLKKFHTLSRINIQLKSKHEIVTPADLASEKIILSHLKKTFLLTASSLKKSATLARKNQIISG